MLWKYRLEKPVVIEVECPAVRGKNIPTEEFLWATIEFDPAGKLRVHAKEGYAWDGCTPKFEICGRIIGVWDGFYNIETHQPDTYYCSLTHDILCQYRRYLPMLTRKDIDTVFLTLLRRYHFFFALPYYFAVRLFARFALKFTRTK